VSYLSRSFLRFSLLFLVNQNTVRPPMIMPEAMIRMRAQIGKGEVYGVIAGSMKGPPRPRIESW
jgi:hypothetical protein